MARPIAKKGFWTGLCVTAQNAVKNCFLLKGGPVEGKPWEEREKVWENLPKEGRDFIRSRVRNLVESGQMIKRRSVGKMCHQQIVEWLGREDQ